MTGKSRMDLTRAPVRGAFLDRLADMLWNVDLEHEPNSPVLGFVV